MVTIGDILRPESIDLDLKTANREEAINHVASLLKEDDRVTDWNVFYKGLSSMEPCLAAAGKTGICIPHTRTESVTGMVMSVGRSAPGIAIPGLECPVHFVFVIGVPLALAADYLRIIGALTRIFRNSTNKNALRNARSKADFVQLLAAAEMKL